MTRDETRELLMKIDVLYPNWKPSNLSLITDAWASALKDYPSEVMNAALSTYMANDRSGFAPVVGQLIGIVRTAKENPMERLTALEAWALVYKAICNSNYNADEEFAKLPKICQKAVGSADNLREMAKMPMDTVNSVQQSHFIRAFNNIQKQEEEYEKIPVPVREMIEATTKKMLEG